MKKIFCAKNVLKNGYGCTSVIHIVKFIFIFKKMGFYGWVFIFFPLLCFQLASSQTNTNIVFTIIHI